jgi:hypothetical protein
VAEATPGGRDEDGQQQTSRTTYGMAGEHHDDQLELARSASDTISVLISGASDLLSITADSPVGCWHVQVRVSVVKVCVKS